MKTPREIIAEHCLVLMHVEDYPDREAAAACSADEIIAALKAEGHEIWHITRGVKRKPFVIEDSEH